MGGGTGFPSSNIGTQTFLILEHLTQIGARQLKRKLQLPHGRNASSIGAQSDT